MHTGDADTAAMLLRLLRTHECSEVLAVASSPFVRMAGSTLALVVGVKIHMFPTREKALAFMSAAA